MRSALPAALLFLAACTDPTTDTTTGEGTAGETSALPSGESEWTGTGDVAGMGFLLDLTLVNTDGDITASVTVRDDPDGAALLGEGTYTMTGTYEPMSQRIALAPLEWTETPDTVIELIGFNGEFLPETNELTGTLIDYATGDDNVLRGGPADLSFVSGDGAPLEPGDEALSLPADETLVFTGTHNCGGTEREGQAELTYDGEGLISGTLTYGDPTLTTGNTFEVTGVHNPTTGGITLTPGVYTQVNGGSFLTYFIDGDFDPQAGTFVGDVRVNQGRCAVQDGFDHSLE